MVVAGELTYLRGLNLEVVKLTFTFITATDMPDYDDRKDLEGDDQEQAAHYSKTQERGKLYGEEKVYIDRNVVDEKIIIRTQIMSSTA